MRYRFNPSMALVAVVFALIAYASTFNMPLFLNNVIGCNSHPYIKAVAIIFFCIAYAIPINISSCILAWKLGWSSVTGDEIRFD